VTPVRARWSGRKRKSNIIYIDGHPVKTENNYVLKGDSYSFGVFEGTATKKSRLTPTKSSQDSPKQATGSKKKISPAELNRMEHNNDLFLLLGRQSWFHFGRGIAVLSGDLQRSGVLMQYRQQWHRLLRVL